MSTLAPDELLVEVEAVAFGAPELAVGAADVPPGGAAVGRVIDTGDAATRLAGKRVLVGPVRSCGECDACRRGKLLACPRVRILGRDDPGALAGQVRTSARWACPLDGALEGAVPGPIAAALPREALAVYTLHARAGLGPGDPTVWLGDGALAQVGAALAAAAGAVVITPDLSLGDADLVRAIDVELEARGARRVAWTVFEASGLPEARRRALALATLGGGGGGTVGLLAGPALGIVPGAFGTSLGEASRASPPAEAPLDAALDAEVRVIGVAVPHPDLLPELAALAAKGVFALDTFVDVVPWADREVRAAALRSAPSAKVVVLAR